MNNYIFPFGSCEKPNKEGISQPWSTLINIIISIIVIYFIINSNNIHSQLFLGTIFLFTLAHAYSHSIHVKGNIQFLLVHFTAILMSVLLLNILYQKTKIIPCNLFIYFIIILYIIDIYLIINDYSNIYSIISFIVILLLIIIYYYNFVSNNLKTNIHIIIVVSIITLLFQINEINNCKKMLDLFPNFPFHIIIELLTTIPIYILCSSLYIL